MGRSVALLRWINGAEHRSTTVGGYKPMPGNASQSQINQPAPSITVFDSLLKKNSRSYTHPQSYRFAGNPKHGHTICLNYSNKPRNTIYTKDNEWRLQIYLSCRHVYFVVPKYEALEIPGWNRNLTVREAFEASCVPAFQGLARQIGAERMQSWIDIVDYGNRNMSALIDVFWLPSKGRQTILISPMEQSRLMQRIVAGDVRRTQYCLKPSVEGSMIIAHQKFHRTKQRKQPHPAAKNPLYFPRNGVQYR